MLTPLAPIEAPAVARKTPAGSAEDSRSATSSDPAPVTVTATGTSGRPARASAPAEPSAGVADFLPLKDATAGQWCRYDALDGRRVEYRIVAVEHSIVRIQTTVIEQGKPVGLPAVREERRDLDPIARQADRVDAARSETSESIRAAGRTWRTSLYEDRWMDEKIGYVRRTWVSPDAPVFGIVRMELRGDDQMEARLELTAAGAN
jgi:hypothetical protein